MLIMSIMLAISGLLGSAIAWDDLKQHNQDEEQKLKSKRPTKQGAC
ncbi:hypothetical protein KFE80_08315 [bacterium SCSIO 12696]|nr:hypothetical protein KFE80_08315 [bacterium SCSIO 12696]